MAPDYRDDVRRGTGRGDADASPAHETSPIDPQRIWEGVAARIWAVPVSWPERIAGNLLRSPALARALVTTPALFLSWALATAAVLAVGVLATPVSGVPLVALVAPALAGGGIAYAYGPGADSAYELSRTMAVSDRMVLLVRSLVVYGLNTAFGLIASLFTAASLGVTVGWLVPMTAVCALALAAATLARSANVGAGAALLTWATVVLAAKIQTGAYSAAVTSEALIPAYLVATTALVFFVLYATSRKGPAWR